MSQPQDGPRRLKQKRRRAKKEVERQVRKLQAAAKQPEKAS
jgi:hypothetical protein